MSNLVHVVYLGDKHVNAVGAVVDKGAASIGEIIASSAELRVIVDSDIPSSVGNPSLEQYLKLEADAGFLPAHIGSNLVVTYKV